MLLTCVVNIQCQTRVKNTPYFSRMCIQFTPFSHINSPKAIPFGAAHISDSPYSGVIPTPPPPRPPGPEHLKALLVQFSARKFSRDILRVCLDPFAFKIRKKCLLRTSHWIFLFIILLNFGNSSQNPLKWLLRGRQIRSTSDTNITISGCNMREENSTWLFRFSKQGIEAGRLHYFYGLLSQNKGLQCG